MVEPSNSQMFSDNDVNNTKKIDTEKNEIDKMKTKIASIKKSTRSPPVVEGYDNFTSKTGIAHFHDEDWTGVDNVDDNAGGSVVDIRSILVGLINDIYDNILWLEQAVAYEITKYLSFGEFKEEDVEVVKKYVTWFFAIVASCFIIYNWFYTMFYRNSINQKVQNPDFSRRKLKEFASTNMYIRLIEPYITFSLFFPEYLEKIFINMIPDFIAEYFNPTLQFTGLFYLIVYIVYNFSNSFRQLFIDIIMLNTSNWIIPAMYGIVFILFLEYFAWDFLWSIEAKIPFLDIIYFIKQVFYFIIIMIFSPFMGGMMCMGLILFFSFFAIYFAGHSVYGVYRNVNDYTNTMRYNIKKGGIMEELSIWDTIVNFINMVFDYLHRYVFQTAFLFMVFWSFSDYTHNIISDTLKTSLLIINCVLIFLIATITLFMYGYSFDITREKTFPEVHTET